MASIQKTENGYRIQYFYRGNRSSATFATKRECNEWLAKKELEKNTPAARRVKFRELLTDYQDKVIPRKKSGDKEHLKLDALKKRFPELMEKFIGDITKSDIAQWRDAMLDTPNGRGGTLSKESVNRYWTIVNHAFNVAVNEWEWLHVNPMSTVKRPGKGKARDRIITADEREMLLYVTGYSKDCKLNTIAKRVAGIFLFSWETAMRAGEIRQLKWSDIRGATASIGDAKTDAGVRKVPLSKEALRIIEQFRLSNLDKEYIFPMSDKTLDSNFRKYKEKAGLSGFTFHDTRATAITHLAKKIDILALAKAIGHKDLKTLMVYYRETPEEIAARLV